MNEHSGDQDREKARADEALLMTQFAVDHAPDAVFWIDENAQFVYVNQAACQSLEYSCEELLRMGVPDIDPTWPMDKWQAMWDTLRESGASTFETVHQTKQGRIFPVEIRANFIEYHGKSLDCAYARDISERKAAEETLRFTQYAVDNVSDIALWVAPDGRFVYVNKAATELLGYTRDELLNMTVFDVNTRFGPEDWSAHWDEVREKRVMTLEAPIITKSGDLIPAEIRINFVEFEGKHYHFTFVRDITERNKAREALYESSQMLKLVLDTIPVTVWWKDRDSVFLGCNYLFTANAGLTSSEEIVGKTDFELPWTEEQARLYRADDREIMESGRPRINYEETQRTAEGGTIWVRTSKVPLRGADSKIIGVLGTFEDITESKASEEALRKASRTLAALTRVNEILVRATEEKELLQQVCQAVVEAGRYLMAWVGFAQDDQEKTVRPVAHAGHEDDYLKQTKMTWGATALGQCPAGTAIRTGKLSVVADVRTEPSYLPWRDHAMKRGYGCSVSLPLITNGQAIGAISLYRAEPGCLDPAEENLLSQLASDLSYGIMSLRARMEQKAAEAARRALERRLDQHKRKFYRETILSVTDGKLDICDPGDLLPYIRDAQARVDVRQPSDAAEARGKVAGFCHLLGLPDDKVCAFVIGAGEAITNALKHGSGGRVYAGKTNGEVWVGVKDKGPGIESLILPRAVLRKGFSTKPSLGLGYSIMLDVADRILLRTTTRGTTVVLIKSLHEDTATPFSSLPDTWEGIPDLIS